METNGKNGTTAPSPQEKLLRVDLTSLRPQPKAIVVWGDPPKEYRVKAADDLKYEDFVSILEAGFKAKTNATDARINMVEIRRQLKLLCSDLTDEVPAEMTYRETVAFLNAANRASQEAQEAPPGDPPAPAPSENPAASMTT